VATRGRWDSGERERMSREERGERLLLWRPKNTIRLLEVMKMKELGLKRKKRLVLPDREKYNSQPWKSRNTWRLDLKIFNFDIKLWANGAWRETIFSCLDIKVDKTL